MMMTHYAYVGVFLVALAILAAWMFIASQRHIVERCCGAVIVLALAFGVWVNVTAMLGYPVDATPSGQVQLLSMLPLKQDGIVYLWVRDADGPRAYVVPYSEGLVSGLMKARDQAGKVGGARIMLKMEQGKSGKAGDSHAGVSNIEGSHNTLGIKITVIPTLPPKT